MKVGYGRVDITPNKPFYLLGYKTPSRNHHALGIHDHIYLNGLLFENEKQKKTFIATGDLLEIEAVVAGDIRQKIAAQFDIDYDHIMIGVTHDHHSVRDFHRTWEFGEFSQEYYDFFVDSFLEVYKKCADTLCNVTIKAGSKVITGYYSNRNHPHTLADNVVSVIWFYHQGKAIAGMVNMAVHSTVLPGSNMYLTADLAGNVCTKLSEQWGFYPLMLIGCAADSSNRFERQGRDFAELERVSSGLAEAISAIKLNQSLNLDGEMKILVQSYEVINDKQSYDASLKKTLQELKADPQKNYGGQNAEHLIKKCQAQLKNPQFYDVIPMTILDMGDLRLFVFPGELASAGGQILRDATNKFVVIAGYTNGFHYYFLEAKDYGLSFETIGNPVPKGTFEKLMKRFVYGCHLLDQDD